MTDIKEQNETIIWQVASLGDRFAALLIDYVPLLLMFILFRIEELSKIVTVLILCWVGIVFLLIPLRSSGMTLGKKIARVQVIPFSSFETGLYFGPDFSLFILREIFKVLLMSVWIVNLIVIVLSKHRRGIHDFLAGTIVVTTKPSAPKVKQFLMPIKMTREIENVTPNNEREAAPKGEIPYYRDIRKVVKGLTKYTKRFSRTVREEETGFRCSECDNELRRGQKYCSNCGQEIEWEDYE
jgi:uncharacterized RDD family membrane protein YckC